MKKVLFILCSLFFFAVATNAQTTEAAKIADKEAKAKAKAKQNEDIEAAIKEIGLTQQVATQFKETMNLYGSKGTEIRKNSALSEEEKEKQLKANMDEKNEKLKALIGADKYKEFNKIRKAQKEKEGASN